MKYYGKNSGGDAFFVEIDGRIWQGHDLSANPINKPERPCDCCVSGEIKGEMSQDGIVFYDDNEEKKSPSFYHDGSKPPGSEEWADIVAKCREEDAILENLKAEEEEMSKILDGANRLLRHCRLADLEVYCRINDIDFETYSKEHKPAIIRRAGNLEWV
jgi:hypothetical protein